MGDRGRDGSVAGGRRPAGDLRSVPLGSQRRRGAHRWDGVGVVEAAADLEYLLLAMWVAPVAEPVHVEAGSRTGDSDGLGSIVAPQTRTARLACPPPSRPQQLGRRVARLCVWPGRGGVVDGGCSEEVECACLEGARRACLVESARAEGARAEGHGVHTGSVRHGAPRVWEPTGDVGGGLAHACTRVRARRLRGAHAGPIVARARRSRFGIRASVPVKGAHGQRAHLSQQRRDDEATGACGGDEKVCDESGRCDEERKNVLRNQLFLTPGGAP